MQILSLSPRWNRLHIPPGLYAKSPRRFDKGMSRKWTEKRRHSLWRTRLRIKIRPTKSLCFDYKSKLNCWLRAPPAEYTTLPDMRLAKVPLDAVILLFTVIGEENVCVAVHVFVESRRSTAGVLTCQVALPQESQVNTYPLVVPVDICKGD